MRVRSFRYEDYSTRRVFLRSYPLHWGSESEAEESKVEPKAGAWEDSKEEPAKVINSANGKKPVKKIILAVIQWGEERVVVLRRVKHKITIYVVNCMPVTIRAPTALISVK